MAQTNTTKIKLLKLWEILCRETDADHPMESKTLIEKLAGFGIPCDRKTLYRDVETLNQFGYEVRQERSRRNRYYVLERKFDLPELRILLDAVQGASFITEKKTLELEDKIASLAGSRKGEVLKRNLVEFNKTKSTNEVIYYSVDEIVRAIAEKKKISFRYFDYDAEHNKVYRKGGKLYKVNPYATVYSDDNYYLLCYHDKYKNITHYRVDRMEGVTMLNDDIVPLNDDKQEFDAAKHKKELFGMFTGSAETVVFEVQGDILDAMFDRFGAELRFLLQKNGNYRFTADVQVSPVFLGWCCSFGNKLKVVEPKNLVEKVKNHIRSLQNLYENRDFIPCD